jgi:hypothetical protein
MIKTWSITTTLRNPKRLRDFLIVLKEIDGENWNFETQKKYQTLLIKNRVYGYGNNQFYNGLSKKQVDLIDNVENTISFDKAKEIFESKGYKDPAMRGRQSINPLRKLGLVSIKDRKICITSLGSLFLGEDYDLGEIFFKSFVKWQIPNPDSRDYRLENGHDIKPFVGTLHLINQVNKKSIIHGIKAKGLSKQEFSLFVPTLTNYKNIDLFSDEIINLRLKMKDKEKREQRKIFEEYKKYFTNKILEIDDSQIAEKLLSNLKDYGDNAIRYFRLTRFIYIRGGGYYVDLEPRRNLEIKNLLNFDNGKSTTFTSKEDYLNFIADITQPILPWETKDILSKIADDLVKDVKQYEEKLFVSSKKISSYESFSVDELKKFIEELRQYRRDLQDTENHNKSQTIECVEEYISNLENIFDLEDKPIMLEKFSTLGLQALNDAEKIQPNYPVGDDNEPTFTAPANTPDIECYYENFNAICEVTMLTGRDQWYNEGQPVMRHLRDFEQKNNDKNSYCLFIAPKLHRDTINTFWMAVKHEYEGKKQRIVPMSIKNFTKLLKILTEIKKRGKKLSHTKLFELYDNIIDNTDEVKDSNEWISNIPHTIEVWEKTLIA